MQVKSGKQASYCCSYILDQDHIVLSQSPEKAACSRIELKRPICQGSETETWGCARGAGGWKMEKGGERPV